MSLDVTNVIFLINHLRDGRELSRATAKKTPANELGEGGVR